MKRHLRKGAFFVPLLLFCSIVLPYRSSAQPLDPLIEAFPPDVYGGHHQLFNVSAGSQGTVWFTGNPKLFQYNGKSWESYMMKDGVPMMGLAIDQNGRIWVGGRGEMGYMEPIPPSAGGEGDSSRKDVGDLRYVSLMKKVPDSLKDFNIVWNVRTLGDRVAFDPYDRLFIYDGKGVFSFKPDLRFYRIHKIDGKLWVQSVKKGFYAIRGLRSERTSSRHIADSLLMPGTERLAGMTIKTVLDDVPGATEGKEVLFCSRSKGVFRYDPTADEGERTEKLGKECRGLEGRFRIYSAQALPDRENPWNASFLVNTLNNGVILLDSNACPLKRITQKNGMPSPFVWNTAEAPTGSGVFWSGTNKGGAKWHLGDPRTFVWEGEAFSGGVEKVIREDGDLYIGTYQGVYRRENAAPEGFSASNEWKRYGDFEIASYEVEAAPHPARNALLVAGGNEGLFALPTDGPKEEKMLLLNTHSYSVESFSLKDTHLIATAGREGVTLLEDHGKRVEPRLRIRDVPQGIKAVQRIQKDDPLYRKGWLSFVLIFGEKSIQFLDIERSKLWEAGFPDTVSFKKGPKVLSGLRIREFQREQLPGDDVNLQRLQGRFYLGTEQGLFEPIPKGKKIGVRPAREKGDYLKGIPPGEDGNAPYIVHLEEREDGTLWLTTTDRIRRILPKEDGNGYRVDSLSLKGKATEVIADFHFEENGITWIASNSGVVRYDRTVDRDPKRDFNCRIREVSVLLPQSGSSMEGKNVERKTSRDSVLFSGHYRKPAPEDPLLSWKLTSEQPDAYVPTLPYEKNGLRFLFAAPFFDGQKKVRYSYKLEGYDDRWSPWKRKGSKTYTNLPEGSYRFKVKAKNLFGKRSEAAVYRFRILPPWYRTWWAYGGYGLAGAGFVLLMVRLNGRRLRKQKERLEKIVRDRTREIRVQKEKTEEQKGKLELAHQEITQSIDYARKIQQALLRSEDEAADHLPDHFIVFKPQSQVSGDFYWFKEHRGYIYIAAMDCTGHGVPGAFMSMLGISQLNEIMSTDEVLSPGHILTELRERVVRELSGSGPETAKDGMDAAILKIPLGNSNSNSNSDEGVRIEFAGAQNPLYVVRKGIAEEDPSSLLKDLSGPKDLTGLGIQDRLKPFKKSPDGIEIKGDPMPVGYDEHAEGDFKTITLRVQKGDMLYIFSDGYADQFGGEKGKKFRYGPFKKLLTELHEKSMEEQKEELDRVFEEWKGDQEQIDDVLVMGVRV